MTTDNRRSHKEAALKHGKLCLWEFFPGKLKLLSEAADVAVTFACIKESAFRLRKARQFGATVALTWHETKLSCAASWSGEAKRLEVELLQSLPLT